MPEKDLFWVQEASAALERDGSSLSAWTLAQLRAWWDMHKPGNPQLGMERYVTLPEAPIIPRAGPKVTFEEKLTTSSTEELQRLHGVLQERRSYDPRSLLIAIELKARELRHRK